MIDLYSVKETAKIFGLSPAQLRYWTQTGFVAPTIRKGGRLFYTFRDLVGVKAAKELLASGVSMDDARPSLETLRKSLPARVAPTTPLSICSDGERIEVTNEDEVAPRSTHEVVMAFRLSTLASQIAEALGAPLARDISEADTEKDTDEPFTPPAPELRAARGTIPESAAPEPSAPANTEPHRQPSAYECFCSGFTAEKDGDTNSARLWYQRALELEPTLAAAHTNLGNMFYEGGDRANARECYTRALEHDPSQAEARYNLGNLLDELGETELAIAEFRTVVANHPEFADAHYNLGLVLNRVGGLMQAKHHLRRYLDFDSDSRWADRARRFLSEAE